MKKTLGLFLVLVMLISLTVTTAYAADMYVFSNNGYPVKLRTSPDASNDDNLIKKITQGTYVDVQYYTNNGNWAYLYVPSEGLYGFMMTQYLTYDQARAEASRWIQPAATAVPSSASKTSGDDAVSAMNVQFNSMRYVSPYVAYVTTNHAAQRINMRWAPTTVAKAMTTFSRGDVVTVLAEGSSWAQVRDESTGMIGFISRSFLTR